MVPQSVFDRMRYPQFYNHGARLVRGERTFSLRKYRGRVRCMVHVRPAGGCDVEGWLAERKRKGWDVFPARGVHRAFASKEIPLSSVPDSEAGEWDCWDEY